MIGVVLGLGIVLGLGLCKFRLELGLVGLRLGFRVRVMG